ncbi:hypothetical protein OF83DRAFT_625380 [Amylostereum chailletii]|nr:hypothetical protein OF83DRAFT_625380 [Amylostereum chailletii]
MSRHAHFNPNPVHDVRVFPTTPPSPTSSISSDEGPITPPSYSVPLPRTSNTHHTPHTPSPLAHPNHYLPVPPRDPHVYTPSPPRGSPQRLVSPAFVTPSPKATSVHVHPALAALHWDPRKAPPAHPPSTRDKPATHPPLPKVVLSTGHLPWKIKVHAPSTASAVSVGDVLDALYDSLRTPVTRPEWDAAVDRKDTIRRAFSRRCGGNEKERAAGVRRVDYLPEGAVFTGLGPYHGASEENLNIEVALRAR